MLNENSIQRFYHILEDEILEIETNFSTSRTALPALYIVTPYENKKNSSYTRYAPSFKILARLQILATEALEVISKSTFELSNNVNVSI